MPALWLKLIAALTMLIDHAGLLLFPDQFWMRCVGRLAMPLYAYFIAEGFRYTRSRGKYLCRLFLLGAGCQIVYYIADGDRLHGILLTFSLSICLMWVIDRARWAWREKRENRYLWTLAATAAVVAAVILTMAAEFDYGIFGVLLPVWVSLCEDRTMRTAALGWGLLPLCLVSASWHQLWSLAVLPVLLLYNGQPGRPRLKWFFYIFYPVHLAVLQCIAWFV